MMAVINGQAAIVEEFFNNRNSKKEINFQKTLRDTKQTLPFLLFLHCPSIRPGVLLKRKDLKKEDLNAIDSKGNTALMACCLANCRETVRLLLSSKAATERHLFDLSIKNSYGRTALHILVMNGDKFNTRLLLNLLEDSGDSLNSVDSHDLTPLMCAFNRGCYDVFDAIINHPKAKTKVKWELKDPKGKTVKQLDDEVKTIRREQKAASIPVPIPKIERTPSPKRNFQDEMNKIYKTSQNGLEKKGNAPNPANSLKRSEPEKPKVEKIKSPEKSKIEDKKISNGVHSNGDLKNGKEEEVDDGPSISELRKSWRKNESAEERRAAIEAEITTDSLLEDLMKKAEQKVKESKPETKETDYITEEMNEEINWALQMKREQAEVNNRHNDKEKVPEETKKEKTLTQYDKMKLLKEEKEKEAEEQKKLSQPSDAEKMANIYQAMEKKADAKKAAKDKRLEPERLRKEEQSIEDAMSEEIQWALEQKRQAADEQKSRADETENERKKKNLEDKEDKRIMDGIKSKNKSKADEETERLRRLEEEKEKLASVQKEVERKIAERKEAQALKAKALIEEDDSLAKLPRWKREKLQKEKEAKAAKDAEDELQERMTEELEWAENLKNQSNVITPKEPPTINSSDSNKLKLEQQQKEKEKKEAEAKLIAQKVEAAAKERDKNPTAADLDRRRQEDLEIQEAMAEEVQWALDQKRQQAEEAKAKEDEEKAHLKAKQNAEEEDKKIMTGISQKKKQQEEKETKAKEEQEAKLLVERERKKSAEKALVEKKKMEELEKKTLEKIESAKNEAEKQKQDKLKKDHERLKREEEERKHHLDEELKWAEEARLQEELEKKENERKAKEKLEAEIKAKADAEREKRRQLALQQEKEMLEKLEKAAAEKLRVQKEEEELKIKKEQEAWEKMPKWKKDKILRERRASSTVSSQNDSPNIEATKPMVETNKVEEEDRTGIDISAIWNASITKASGNGGVPELAVTKTVEEAPKVEEEATDKFSEWLKQELHQAGGTPGEVRPPPPVRRKSKEQKKKEEDVEDGSSVAAVRPNRRSRVEEMTTELVAPDEPAKSPVPARRMRKSPLPPSPAPIASKGDISNLIDQSSELDDPETRAELMMIIQAFILEKRGKL